MTPDPFDDLRGLYARLDAQVERRGWCCRGCGDCCHFETFGHELFCSDLEADWLLEDASLEPSQTGGCPLLRNNRCTARDRRALSCRTFFCSRELRREVEDLTETFLGQLKELHRRWGRPWAYRRLSEHASIRKGLQNKGL